LQVPQSEFDARGRPPVVSYSRRGAPAAAVRGARNGAVARLLKVGLTTLVVIAGTAFLALPMPWGGENPPVQPILSVGVPQDAFRMVPSDALAVPAAPVVPSASIDAVGELAALPQQVDPGVAPAAAASAPVADDGAAVIAANGKPPLPRLRPASGTAAASATTAAAAGNQDAILKIVGWLIHTQ
jgi:hypothetical protein